MKSSQNPKSFLAIIPARAGSKGIKNKNMTLVNGRPLIQYTLDCSLELKNENIKIAISSNDENLLNFINNNGYHKSCSFISRPHHLCQDHSTCEEAVLHSIDFFRGKRLPANKTFDYIILLQPTSPLRTADTIKKCIEQVLKTSASSLVSVCKTKHSPYKMVRINKKGEMEPVCGVKDYLTKSRQELPDVFIPNGAVYIVKTDIFVKTKSFFHKDTQLYVMPDRESIDIDTMQDVYDVERIMIDKIKVVDGA